MHTYEGWFSIKRKQLISVRELHLANVKAYQTYYRLGVHKECLDSIGLLMIVCETNDLINAHKKMTMMACKYINGAK